MQVPSTPLPLIEHPSATFQSPSRSQDDANNGAHIERRGTSRSSRKELAESRTRHPEASLSKDIVHGNHEGSLSEDRTSENDAASTDTRSIDIQLEPSSGLQTPATGVRTPDPLLGRRSPDRRLDLLQAVDPTEGQTDERERRRTSPHSSLHSHERNPSADESGSPTSPITQSIPPELSSFLAEIVFILICSTSQLLFSLNMGDVVVNQDQFVNALDIPHSQTPWLLGSTLLANGLSVVISGSLADLVPPKRLMVGSFVWLSVWNIVGVFSISPKLKILFFVMRAMQGLAVGILCSTTLSILGRVYNPGIRKTRVFSVMSSMAPIGFFLGALQGGALSSSLHWIFGSNAIMCAMCSVAAFFTIPPLKPAKDHAGTDAPSLKDFDWLGAFCSSIACGCILFGLTQGSSARWQPYTWSLVIVGVALLVAFYFIERRAARPLIPNTLWQSPGFTPLMISYFLGFGSYLCWQFYAISFFLRLQHASPLRVALYLTPNAVVGILATWIVSISLHHISNHWILTASMVAFSMGPVFFLPQTPNTSYWALSMPGIAFASFGPDLSFAASSIFITSSVKRSYQGSAGSLLVTVQNLSAAVITAVGDTIGFKVTESDGAEDAINLHGLRSIWWFCFAITILPAILTATRVRIPKAEEKEHTR
ncbi:MAG: hypothetical protein M1831_001549 [Alyxoria varia]|nr:MAG: hypothetical protein M1831_001549 [Alyxoria varia]